MKIINLRIGARIPRMWSGFLKLKNWISLGYNYGNQTAVFCFHVYGVLYIFKNHPCSKNKKLFVIGEL